MLRRRQGEPALALRLARILLFALAALVAAGARATAYEAALPDQLHTDPNLCAYAPCRDVLPGADSFSPRMGRPPYVAELARAHGNRELAAAIAR